MTEIRTQPDTFEHGDCDAAIMCRTCRAANNAQYLAHLWRHGVRSVADVSTKAMAELVEIDHAEALIINNARKD